MPKKKTSKVKKLKKSVEKKVIAFSNSVTKLLDEAKVKYNILEHRVVFTAHDVSATTKKKLGEIAKVVLVKVNAPKGNPFAAKGLPFALIVLPAGKYVDFSGIKKALKAKKVSMANEKDITKYLKTTPSFDGVPGRMTGQTLKPAMLLNPFGNFYNIQTLLDKGMSRAKKMIASAGTYTHSVELAMKDFEKIVKPIKGTFSKAKK